MRIFFFDIACILTFITVTGVMGVLIRDGIGLKGRYSFLADPLFGTLTWSSLSLFVYCAAHGSFRSSTIIAAALLLPYGGYRLVVSSKQRKMTSTLLCMALPLAMIIIFAVDKASISANSRSMLFMDGSDQAGYAQMADWLTHHTSFQRPMVSPDLPYDSYPQFLMEYDPRFATFSLLASISGLLHYDGMFALDLCFSMFLLVGLIGVAGLVAESATGLLLGLLALGTGTWFDYARSGYLGKVFGYPLILLVVITICTVGFRISRQAIPFLIAFGTMAATAHSGVAIAITIAPIAAIYFGLNCIDRGKLQSDAAKTALGVWVSTLVILVASTGMLAKPLPLPFNYPMPFSWLDLTAAMAEITTVNNILLQISLPTKLVVLSILFITLVIAFMTACLFRQKVTVAIMLGPALIYLAYIITDHEWAAYQSIGIIRALLIVALVRSFDEFGAKFKTSHHARWVPLTALFILTATALPRFVTAVDRYVVAPPTSAIVSESDIARAKELIGGSRLEIDVQEPLVALIGLVEFDQPGANTQWSERGYNVAVGYRKWTWPRQNEKAQFVLVDAASQRTGDQVVMKSGMFSIVSR